MTRVPGFERASHGTPYMQLSMAKKMQHNEEDKWRRLKKAAMGTPPEPYRYDDGTCVTHSGGRTQ